MTRAQLERALVCGFGAPRIGELTIVDLAELHEDVTQLDGLARESGDAQERLGAFAVIVFESTRVTFVASSSREPMRIRIPGTKLVPVIVMKVPVVASLGVSWVMVWSGSR